MWQRIKQSIVLGCLILFSGLGLAWGEEMVAPQQSPNPARITDAIRGSVDQQIETVENAQSLTPGQLVAVAVAEQAAADPIPIFPPPPTPIPVNPSDPLPGPIFPPPPTPVPADEEAAAMSVGGGDDPPIIIDIDPPPGTTTVQLEEVKDPVTGEVIAIKVTYYDVDGVPILPPLAPDPVPMVSPPPPDATVINAGPNGEPYYFDDDGNLLPCPPAGGDDCLPEDDSAGMLP